MNPLIDKVTQDYFLLSMEMIRIPVTGSKSKEIVVGLYYKKEDAYKKDCAELNDEENYVRYRWIVVNNNTGKYTTVVPSYLYPWSNEYSYETFFDEVKEAIKLTDEAIEDAAFEFDITKQNIDYVYKTFSMKWNEIKKLGKDHPNFMYELAMTDWKYRKYLLVHFDDSVLDFKYEAGVISIYDNEINAYVFEDRTPITNLIFNTDYIKTHFYSTLFDLRKPHQGPEIDKETTLPLYEKDDGTTTIKPQYDIEGNPKYHIIENDKAYLRDFQRFQYALLELLIQPKIKQYYYGDNNFTETFKINDKEVISFSLDTEDTIFNPSMYFGMKDYDEYYATRVLSIIDHTQISSNTITHQIFNINLVNSDTTIAPYVLTNFAKKTPVIVQDGDDPVDDEIGDDEPDITIPDNPPDITIPDDGEDIIDDLDDPPSVDDDLDEGENIEDDIDSPSPVDDDIDDPPSVDDDLDEGEDIIEDLDDPPSVDDDLDEGEDIIEDLDDPPSVDDDLDDFPATPTLSNTNNVFLTVDTTDNTIVYNTNKLFEFLINRLIRHYFQTEKTFLDDKPRIKNIVTHIPLRY